VGERGARDGEERVSWRELTPVEVRGARDVESDSYTSFDGSTLAYRRWPAAAPQSAPLVYLHGIESHGGWFDATATLLAAAGIPVYAFDRRGSGLNRAGRGHCRAYEYLLLDVVAGIQHIGGAPVHLVGLSWGGKLAFALTHQYARYVRSLVLITPGILPRVALPPGEQLRVLMRWLANSRKTLALPLTTTLFSDEPEVQRFIENDALRLTQATPQLLWESRRLDGLLRHVDACPVPLFAMLSRQDRIIDTPRTEQWLAALHTPKTRVDVLDRGHALQLECPELVAERVREWIIDVEGMEN